MEFDESDDKKHSIYIRVSQKEKELIQQGAKRAKRSVSNWLRWLASNASKEVD